MIFRIGENLRNLLKNPSWADFFISWLEKKTFDRIIHQSKKKFVKNSDFENQNSSYIFELKENGVLFLPSYFEISQSEIEYYQNLLNKKGELHDSVLTYYPDPLNFTLEKLYHDIFIQNLVNHTRGYESKNRVVRLYYSYPLEQETGSFLWHHDALFDYYKVIVYLSEVQMENGPFAYCLGSHKNSWKYYSYQRSRFEEKELNHYEIKYYFGKPGDVIILNANGIHKANNPQKGFNRLVGSLAFIDFDSDQSTDHYFVLKQKLSYLKK